MTLLVVVVLFLVAVISVEFRVVGPLVVLAHLQHSWVSDRWVCDTAG